MPIAFTCTCGKRLKVADESAGKKLRCPDCGAVNLVPSDPPDEFVQPLEDKAGAEAPPARKTGNRIFREDGAWQVGDEVHAPMAPDCLNVGIIRELLPDKALIEFPHHDFTGWVFTHTLQNIVVHQDQEVKCFEQGGAIRDGKVLRIQGDNIRVVLGNNYGMGLPIDWTGEEAQFDIAAIGIPCQPDSPGAKTAEEFAFYENLQPEDRVWAPWERFNLYPGKVAEVKDHEVHVHFDNGNRGWVWLGQIFPFSLYIGEYVTVCKGAGLSGTIVADDGKRVQVRCDDGGKEIWAAPAKLMRSQVLPVGPDARPTRFAGGLLLKLLCIPLGLLLALSAGGGLIWSEDYHAKHAQTIAEGASSCIAVSADRIDPAHDGKLVHLAGEATTGETLHDEVFNIPVSTKALKLVRTVEIFQWVERSETKKETQGGKEVKVTYYHHEGKWVREPVSSLSFHEDAVTGKKPVNVVGPKPPNAVVRPKEVKLGAFGLSDEQVDRIGSGEKLSVPEQAIANAPEELKKKVKILDGVIYVCMYPDTDPTNPNVGDVRITFTDLKPQPVTVVAKQTQAGFEPWVSSTGTHLDELRPGILTKEEMFQKAEESHNLLNLIVRVGGGAILAVGFYLLLVHWWLWRKFFRPKTIAG